MKEDFDRQMQQAELERDRRMQMQLRALLSEMGIQSNVPAREQSVQQEHTTPVDAHQSCKASCSEPKPFPEIPEEGLKCVLLANHDGRRCGVAHATLDKSKILHNKVLDNDQVKATIYLALHGDANIPFPPPNVDISIVEDALCTFIAWPKKDVDFDIEKYNLTSKDKEVAVRDRTVDASHVEKKSSTSLGNSKFDPLRLPSELGTLYWMLQANKEDIIVKFAPEVMNSEGLNFVHLSKADIMQFLKMAWLNVSCLEIYILYLHDRYRYTLSENMYGFLRPSIVSHSKKKMDQNKYFEKHLRDLKSQRFFVAYFENHHWMLAVVCPRDNTIYWLDPQGEDPRNEFKMRIDKAMKLGQVHRKERQKSVCKFAPQWINVNCPHQTGGVECGYYVMMYMQRILEQTPTFPSKCFGHTEMTYTQDQIDEFRNEWAKQLHQYVLPLREDGDEEEDY